MCVAINTADPEQVILIFDNYTKKLYILISLLSSFIVGHFWPGSWQPWLIPGWKMAYTLLLPVKVEKSDVANTLTGYSTLH